ncbi:MAG: hypothetical protein DHS80DRAFT_24575 [Piptocephalis tieghemiana]|nr:MAG: hypothetical protein DHS80DRAFT_24575 [Piptocephalis tieghemiana]
MTRFAPLVTFLLALIATSDYISASPIYSFSAWKSSPPQVSQEASKAASRNPQNMNTGVSAETKVNHFTRQLKEGVKKAKAKEDKEGEEGFIRPWAKKNSKFKHNEIDDIVGASLKTEEFVTTRDYTGWHKNLPNGHRPSLPTMSRARSAPVVDSVKRLPGPGQNTRRTST